MRHTLRQGVERMMMAGSGEPQARGSAFGGASGPESFFRFSRINVSQSERHASFLVTRSSSTSSQTVCQRDRVVYFTEYLVNAPPAWLNEFGPSAA